MAGVSIKSIKSRIKSVESTMQITRAMELVSSSKLQKAKKRAENAKPVHDILIDTLVGIQKDTLAKQSVFFTAAEEKSVYIIIAGDRGLAGGYNNNLFRAVAKHSGNHEITAIPIGKKALDYYKSHGHMVLLEDFSQAALTTSEDCSRIAAKLVSGFVKGEISRIYIAYNRFHSILVQEPVIETLLPAILSESEEVSKELTIYEPSAEEVLYSVVLQYLSTYIYCALCEAVAAEHAARRNAMNAANKNGSKMIDDMRLQYNRARQAVITQELTEIVAGAEAL